MRSVEYALVAVLGAALALAGSIVLGQAIAAPFEAVSAQLEAQAAEAP